GDKGPEASDPGPYPPSPMEKPIEEQFGRLFGGISEQLLALSLQVAKVVERMDSLEQREAARGESPPPMHDLDTPEPAVGKGGSVPSREGQRRPQQGSVTPLKRDVNVHSAHERSKSPVEEFRSPHARPPTERVDPLRSP